jgi:hypothetical protein
VEEKERAEVEKRAELPEVKKNEKSDVGEPRDAVGTEFQNKSAGDQMSSTAEPPSEEFS